MKVPAATLERVWIVYLAVVLLVGLVVPGGGDARHAPWTFVGVHAALLAVVPGVGAIARRNVRSGRVLRSVFACTGLPIVFSALCWLLPSVHPEPFEFAFAATENAVFGDTAARAGDRLPAWLVEYLQWTYAAFYGYVMAAALGAGLARGGAAYDRAVLILVGGFLVSYLGYLWVPTLGPNVVLAFAAEPTGLWTTEAIRAAIDAGESNPWDCFPSGHTMLTLTSLGILWRWNRRWFWWTLLPASSLVVSTVLLRYHWVGDVLAGALLAWLCTRAFDALADRDGWPPA